MDEVGPTSAARETVTRELKLLTDRRDDPVEKRRRPQQQLRWQLRDLDSELAVPPGGLDSTVWLDPGGPTPTTWR